jgi:hypothetical protein
MLKYSNFCFRWGDVTLNTASDGAKYLQLNKRQTKTRTGENLSDVREVTPKIYEAEDESPERDPIKIYEIYSTKRPNNFSNADDPFYIPPRTIPLEDSKTNIWFLRQKARLSPCFSALSNKFYIYRQQNNIVYIFQVLNYQFSI